MRAAAIVMALPRRVDGASLFGKTLETVLAERPCRVVIESTPPPEGDGRRRRELEQAEVTPMRALTRLTSGLMVFLGVAIVVRTIDAGGGAGRARDPGRRAVRRRRRRAAVPHARARRGAAMPRPPSRCAAAARRMTAAAAQARPRLAGAVRDRPGLRRRLDLLRASASSPRRRSG